METKIKTMQQWSKSIFKVGFIPGIPKTFNIGKFISVLDSCIRKYMEETIISDVENKPKNFN